MKGFAHYLSAVAAASFLPQAVQRSAQGSFVLLWAALGGLLPDVLDFKVARYLVRADVEVGGGRAGLDPVAMAIQVAGAVARAFHSRRPVRVQFHTVRLGADRWQGYSVHLEEGRVRVRVGPQVDTSQVPYLDGDAIPRVGSAPVDIPVQSDAVPEIAVDILQGPMVEFRRRGGGVEALFLPWHRQGSHSLVVAVLVGLVIGWLWGPLAGLAYSLGTAVHILEDQLGHMGSCLFYPLLQRRIGGLKLFHSGEAMPNLLTVWLSVMLILLNLNRFSSSPVTGVWRAVAAALVASWLVVLGLFVWARARRRGFGASNGRAEVAEAAAEMEELEI